MATPQEVEDFIRTYTPIAAKVSSDTGVPVMVILAQAAQESGWGTSKLAKSHNAFFGVTTTTVGKEKGVDYVTAMDGEHLNNFQTYSTPSESFYAHSQLLQGKRYEKCWSIDKNDTHGWFVAIKEAGYAADPNYVKNLDAIAASIQKKIVLIYGETEANEILNNNFGDLIAEDETINENIDTPEMDVTSETVTETREQTISPEEKDAPILVEEGNGQDNLLMSLLSGTNGQNGDIFSSLFLILIAALTNSFQIGATQKERDAALQSARTNRETDISSLIPDCESAVLMKTQNGTTAIILNDSGETLTHVLSPEEETALYTKMSAPDMTQEQRINYFSEYIYDVYTTEKANSAKSSQAMNIQDILSDEYESIASQNAQNPANQLSI